MYDYGMLTEQTLKCKECGQDFVFSVGEQEFFKERGLTNHPKRCEDCRTQRKAQSSNSNKGQSQRPPHKQNKHFPAVCSRCAAQFDAPFEPKTDRPVFCRACFDASKRSSTSGNSSIT